MQHRSIRNGVSITAVLLVAFVAPGGSSGDFSITRSTIDGGGGMFSTGGDFELSGTIGQADAGAMSADGFTLVGGFWFALAKGDCNADGVVTFPDFIGFDECINASGPGGGLLSPQCACFDFDGDNDNDLEDFALFQRIIQE